MTLTEKLIEKVAHLPPERQMEILDFAEFIANKAANDVPLHDPEGMLADIPSNLTLEEFKAARREAWKNAPREFPE